MLRNLDEIQNYNVITKEEEYVGIVDSFLFDDENGIIRYLVVDLDQLNPRRKVLISPISIDETKWAERKISLSLVKEQIKNSPDIGVDKPVSKQKELELIKYYNLPEYFDPKLVNSKIVNAPPTKPEKKSERNKKQYLDKSKMIYDTHLRSTKEIIGYDSENRNGIIGKVENFIAEDENWTIRFIVIDARSLVEGKKILISPERLENIKWESSKIYTDVSQEEIENCPEYDPTGQVNVTSSTVLYDYYGQPEYWKG
jgi:hypothetical protein